MNGCREYEVELSSGRRITVSSPRRPERDPRSGELLVFDRNGVTARLNGWRLVAPRAGSIAASAAANGRPVVKTADLDRATRHAWKLLCSANDPATASEFIFRYGGQPSRFEHTDEGRLTPVSLNANRMRHRLSEIASWRKAGGEGYQQGAPQGIVNNVLATPDPPIPVVARIVGAPILRQDGSVLDEPGYDRRSRAFYEPTDGLEVPTVKARPTRAERKSALRLIVRELFADFPFVGEAERAHAIALFLQPFIREMVNGPTPLYLIEAPTPGSGKGLLADVACWAALGGRLPLMAEGGGEDEWRKRITSTLMSAPAAILLDNIQDKLDSAALSAALTTTEWSDRKLGVSENVALPNRAVWIATGNNPGLSGEIMRRSVRIRLDPETEHPEDRADFRHADLRAWAAENRGDLVWAALTLARAWVAAGKPPGERSLGSFEDWARVMGGILKTAGVPGFLDNLAELRDHGGSEREEMTEFLAAWHRRHGEELIVAKKIDYTLMELVGIDPSNLAAGTKLGKRLSRERGRRYGDFVLRKGDGRRGGVATWRVERVGGTGG